MLVVDNCRYLGFVKIALRCKNLKKCVVFN